MPGDPAASWIASYIPKFYGTDVSADGKKQIVIENLLKGYAQSGLRGEACPRAAKTLSTNVCSGSHT
eukprot:1196179-Prorocentrum_minimum.AAC.4